MLKVQLFVWWFPDTEKQAKSIEIFDDEQQNENRNWKVLLFECLHFPQMQTFLALQTKLNNFETINIFLVLHFADYCNYCSSKMEKQRRAEQNNEWKNTKDQ